MHVAELEGLLASLGAERAGATGLLRAQVNCWPLATVPPLFCHRSPGGTLPGPPKVEANRLGCSGDGARTARCPDSWRRASRCSREPACAPRHSPPPSSSPRGARRSPPLQTLSGDPGGLQDVSLHLQPCRSRRRQEPGLLLINVTESKREAVWGPDASRWVWVAAGRRGLSPGPGALRAAVPQGSH